MLILINHGIFICGLYKVKKETNKSRFTAFQFKMIQPVMRFDSWTEKKKFEIFPETGVETRSSEQNNLIKREE